MFLTAMKTIEKTQSNAKGPTPPEVPTINQQWIDTSGDKPVLKEWNGTEWEVIELDIELMDPETIEKLNQTIQDNEAKIDQALQNAQDAIDKAGLNDETIKEMVDSVDKAVEDAKNSLDKSQEAFNSAENLKATVSALDEREKSSTLQLSNQIASKVENKDFESFKTQTADSISTVVKDTNDKITSINQTADNILTTINDPKTGLNATYQKVQSATQDVTQIKDLSGSSTIVNTVKGLNTTVESKADKTSVTQLATQVSTVVESQDALNTQVSTATSNISKLQNNLGQTNKRLETAEGTITSISKQTSDNKKLITQIEATANGANIAISDLSGKVTKLEVSLDKFESNVGDIGNLKEGIKQNSTLISQNKDLINLVASSDSKSYFQISGDKIYAKSKKFVLDSNVEVGNGFTLSADKIKTNTLSGKNVTLNLDTGIYTTTNPVNQSQTILADGGIQSKKGTDFVNIGFGNDGYSTGFGIQLKRNNTENGVLAFDEDSFSVSTAIKTPGLATLGIGSNRAQISLGSLGNRAMLQFIKSENEVNLNNINEGTVTNFLFQDGKGGKFILSNNRPKLYANDSNSMQMGPGYQDVYVNGNKTISVHETYVDITLNGVTRRLGASTLSDGTPTFFFGTTDKKAGFHFSGGRPYVQIAGATYAFDTKYLIKK